MANLYAVMHEHLCSAIYKEIVTDSLAAETDMTAVTSAVTLRSEK